MKKIPCPECKKILIKTNEEEDEIIYPKRRSMQCDSAGKVSIQCPACNKFIKTSTLPEPVRSILERR